MQLIQSQGATNQSQFIEDFGLLKSSPSQRIEPLVDSPEQKIYERSRIKRSLMNQKRISIRFASDSLGFDLDELFLFETNKQEKRYTIHKSIPNLFGTQFMDLDDDSKQINIEDIPKFFAFYLLGQQILIGGIILPWSVSVASEKVPFESNFLKNKFLRGSYRWFFQTIFMIPFVLYEYRNSDDKEKKVYNLNYIFQTQHIRKLYISSLNTSMTSVVSMSGSQWTFVINVTSTLLTSQMTNFWLSLSRKLKQDKLHFTEGFGLIACIIGLIVLSYDAYTTDSKDYPPNALTSFRNKKIFITENWQRILVGHGLGMSCAFTMSRLSKYTVDIKNIFPPFLSMFLICLLNCLHLTLASYFFDGSFVSNQPFWGWFSNFTEGRYIHYMCLAMIINFGMIMSQMFLIKLFEPTMLAMTTLLEPVLAYGLLQLFGVQIMPHLGTFVAYLLIIPGQFFILTGQYILKKEVEYQEKLKNLQNLSPFPAQSVEKISETKSPGQLLENSLNVNLQTQKNVNFS